MDEKEKRAKKMRYGYRHFTRILFCLKKENRLEIKIIQKEDCLWDEVIDYAKNCSWGAGPYPAKTMSDDTFSDWERVFVATEQGNIVGYCTFVKNDCIPECIYTPFIGFVFVGEPYRGNRLSGKLIEKVLEYAKKIRFSEVYICSEEQGLYEKYGFKKMGEAKDYWGNMEQIFRIKIV